MLNRKAGIALTGMLAVTAMISMDGANAGYIAPNVHVDNQSVNAPYRFDYQVTGPDAARPIQVFSDGTQTFLQFASGSKPLYAFVDGNKQSFHETSPYFVLYGAPSSFDVQTSKGKISVALQNNGTVDESLIPKSERYVTENDLRGKFDQPIERQVITAAEATAARLAHERSTAVSAPATVAAAAGVSVQPHANQPPITPADQSSFLPAGGKLSDELRSYVKSMGWNDLKWKIDIDYHIDNPIPMNGDMFTAITNLVKTYQSQGGLQGVTPMFAAGNRVVVIQKMDEAPDMDSASKKQ